MSAAIGRPSGYLGAGRIPVPAHAHPIVRDLVRAMNLRAVSFDSLAERTGVNARTMSGWRSHYTPRLDNIEAALNGVGLRLAIVPLEDDEP